MVDEMFREAEVLTTAQSGRARDEARAMAGGTGAIAAAWRDAAHTGHDPDLIPLRDRDDFRALMMHLAMPADPFATARRGAQSESRAARAFRAERLSRSGCIADTAM
jgi:hypothetical protein